MIMKPECMLCCLRMALEIAKLEIREEATLKTVLKQTMKVLDHLPDNTDSFLVGLKIHEIIEAASGNGDPCRKIRQTNNKQAEDLLPIVRDWVDKHSDPLWAASKAAVMGNLMDIIVAEPIDSARLTDLYLKKPYAVDDLNVFRSMLGKAKKIVYLGDNAGEVYFDRLFIQKLDLPTTYFVKGFPFANDAQYEDVVSAGIQDVAAIDVVRLPHHIEMNMKSVEIIYADFLKATHEADIVVIKGQANYELFRYRLSDAFYLFVHKCAVIAKMDEANIGDMVFARKTNESII